MEEKPLLLTENGVNALATNTAERRERLGYEWGRALGGTGKSNRRLGHEAPVAKPDFRFDHSLPRVELDVEHHVQLAACGDPEKGLGRAEA